MQMKWRRKLLLVSNNDHETTMKGELDVDKKEKLDGKSKKGKKSEQKANKKAKWALSRPPPVETSYSKSEGDDMPRISIELTMKELQDEALARGIERQFMPDNKVDLLDFLVDGSIHLRKTKAWMDVERLKSKMEEDCRRMEEVKSKATASMSETHSGSDKFETGPVVLNNDFREYDLPDPVSFSSRDASLLSSLQSTLPSRLTFQGYKQNDRSIISNRSLLSRRSILSRQDRSLILRRDTTFQTQTEESAMAHLMRIFSGACGFHMCNAPTGNSNQSVKMIDRQKEKELEEVMERRNQLKEGRKKESKEQQEKWDESIQFEPWIITPPENNKKPSGSNLKGFTVWCSIASDALDSPPKQFDSTYKSLGDANDRARYLFFWRNPWRASPATMAELVLIKADSSQSNESASTFHCVHPNGDKWIVSVVHDSTFKYLDNASMTRHSLDQVF